MNDDGAIRLTWRDRNWAEQGHYIYRSDTPMDVNNLPNPIDTLEGNVTEYIDYDVIADQTYFYRVAAYRNNDTMISEEIEVVAVPIAFSSDIFMDDSNVLALYFEENLEDINLRYSGTAVGNNISYGYVNGNTPHVSVDDSTHIDTGLDIRFDGEISISFWVRNMSNTGIFTCDRVTMFQQGQGDVLIWHSNNGANTYTRYNNMLSNVLNDDKWNHVTLSVKNDNTMDFYENSLFINKSPDTTTNASGAYGSSTFKIGGWDSGSYGKFSGDIALVRVFDRVLSSTEVSQLFEEGQLLLGV